MQLEGNVFGALPSYPLEIAASGPSCLPVLSAFIQVAGAGPRERAWDPVPTAYFLQLPPGSFLVLVPGDPALLMSGKVEGPEHDTNM